MQNTVFRSPCNQVFAPQGFGKAQARKLVHGYFFFGNAAITFAISFDRNARDVVVCTVPREERASIAAVAFWQFGA